MRTEHSGRTIVCDAAGMASIGMVGGVITPEMRRARAAKREQGRRRAEAVTSVLVPRQKLPCAFLGLPTGKRHKVGCVDAYLPEHACGCGERSTEVRESKRRPGELLVLPPRAVPGGRCRDLDALTGVVSCLDCTFYRAGLLRRSAEPNIAAFKSPVWVTHECENHHPVPNRQNEVPRK